MSGRQPDRAARPRRARRPPAAPSASTRSAASRATSSLRGRPRGRLRGTTAPRSKISPPQTPHGSCRSTAPARHSTRSGQSPQSDLASSSSAGESANHRSGSNFRQGRFASSSTAHVERGQRQTHRPVTSLSFDLVDRCSDVLRRCKKLRPRIPVCGFRGLEVSRWSVCQTGLPRGGTPRTSVAAWRVGCPCRVNPLVPLTPRDAGARTSSA